MMKLKYTLEMLIMGFAFSACGDDGAAGLNGTAGSNGRNGSNGSNGLDGANGVNGLDGAPGVNGTNGTNGQDGTPGTVIVPIQLCPPNFVPTYPNVFPEIAFKIGTKLFGVYSANGGFMVELTPGTYNSNGINASCSFTVHSDGSVSW